MFIKKETHMFTNIDWQVHLQHHQDLLREAEQARRVKIALSAARAHKTEQKAAKPNERCIMSTTTACCQIASA